MISTPKPSDMYGFVKYSEKILSVQLSEAYIIIMLLLDDDKMSWRREKVSMLFYWRKWRAYMHLEFNFDVAIRGR